MKNRYVVGNKGATHVWYKGTNTIAQYPTHTSIKSASWERHNLCRRGLKIFKLVEVKK